jgi:toxin ParE1/3/4
VTKNRLVLSDAAVADILEQAEWYSTQSGRALAERWENAVTSAVKYVLSHPTAGMLCRFRSHELRNLRRASVPGFRKHVLFYTFDSEQIFVLRVVHGARDLEPLL